MRILFNVAHPAHVHLFRNPIDLLQERGHVVKIVAFGREITEGLLKAYGLEYISLGEAHKDLLVKYMDTLRLDFRMVKLIKDNQPDIIVSTGVPYSAQAARLSGIPSIAFSDTEIAALVLQATLPFVSAICTPSCFDLDLGSKHVKYNGYHELAYLHPDYFSPNPSILERVGLEENEPYFLLRISSWDSSHDIGSQVSLLGEIPAASSFLDELEEYGKVFLTSELSLPQELKKYELRIQPHLMHDLLGFATMYIGEGATMASEAGVLGVPWIYVSRTTRGYLRDQEDNYGLGYVVTTWDEARGKASELLKKEDLGPSWRSKREKLLREKIDVSAFITEFVEDWPESFNRLSKGG